MEVELHFNQTAQKNLFELVPIICKEYVNEEILSAYQKNLAKMYNLEININYPINTQTFKNQVTVISLKYVILLLDLGVDIVNIRKVASGYASNIFKKNETPKIFGKNLYIN